MILLSRSSVRAARGRRPELRRSCECSRAKKLLQAGKALPSAFSPARSAGFVAAAAAFSVGRLCPRLRRGREVHAVHEGGVVARGEERRHSRRSPRAADRASRGRPWRNRAAHSRSPAPCAPGWPMPSRMRRKSLPICASIDFRPLWPAALPPVFMRILPGGRSSSS